MWQLSADNSQLYNFIYFLCWSCVFFIGLTIFSVPYVAMGYEMSDDYHERTRLMAVAQWIGQWAWVIAPGRDHPRPLANPLRHGHQSRAFVIVVTHLITHRNVRDAENG